MGATSLGIATAYGYAKSKGYTGTEEEFTQLMYDLTIDVPAAEAAIASANSAAAKIDNMTVAAQAATGSNPSAVISEVSGHKHILFKLVKGDQGDAGEGVPSGGTTGQVLKKASGTDYDTEWANDAGGVQIDDTAGIGDTDVTWSANKSATELASKYEKPSGGIPDTDLSSAVQTSLGLADSAYQKPSGGIPATDIASGVIPDISGKADKTDTVLLTSLSLGRKADTTVGIKSVATGYEVTASGDNSHAEGGGTTALGAQAHAEGSGTLASGNQSHAEGTGSNASGANSHAEGAGTTASATQAHAEGGGTTASGNNSHAEGSYARASGSNSHAEGSNTYAAGEVSHAEGYGYSSTATNYGALGKADHSEGYRTKANSGSTSSYYGAHAEGYYTEATSRAAHAEGYYTKASGTDSHAEGYYSKASSAAAHAEGNYTRAAGNATHAEGQNTYASGAYSHAEGWGYSSSSTAYGALGTADHSEGYQTKANSGNSYAAHAEGLNTNATAGGTHAEGASTTASGTNSHAEGGSTTASGIDAHAEGYRTIASGYYSHAEGYGTIASGYESHAEGYNSIAKGDACHAEGYGTEANRSNLVGGQHVFGTYNIPIVDKIITITAGGGETWEQHKAYKAYSCYFEVNDGVVTAYYVPHANVPAYIDPTLDYVQGYWHTYTLPSGTSMSSIPEWDRDTLYPQDSVVKVLLDNGTYQAFQNHVAITTTYVPYTSGSYYHTQSVGSQISQYQNILEIVGNGISSPSWSKSNARTLDVDGNERLMGDLYVHCDKYSEGGTKVATETAVNGKADKANPVFTGSISMGRMSGSTVGDGSTALGSSVVASGYYSHAEGQGHMDPDYSPSSLPTTASALAAHAENLGTTASGEGSHAEGIRTVASGEASHAQGHKTTASGLYADANGNSTTAKYKSQHVFGESNVIDSNGDDQTVRGNYVEIVGNGTSTVSRSNARVLDWNGNERIKGDLYVGCNADSTGGTKVAKISEVIPKPVSASAGDFLCFNGTDWVATTLATWQGGSY